MGAFSLHSLAILSESSVFSLDSVKVVAEDWSKIVEEGTYIAWLAYES